jgi:hypothetical protein
MPNYILYSTSTHFEGLDLLTVDEHLTRVIERYTSLVKHVPGYTVSIEELPKENGMTVFRVLMDANTLFALASDGDKLASYALKLRLESLGKR